MISELTALRSQLAPEMCGFVWACHLGVIINVEVRMRESKGKVHDVRSAGKWGARRWQHKKYIPRVDTTVQARRRPPRAVQPMRSSEQAGVRQHVHPARHQHTLRAVRLQGPART